MRYGLMMVAAAFALAACSLDIPPSPPGFACEPDGRCGDGMMCVDTICVPEPPACATAVGAGDGHSCAIRNDGTAWCWGRNDAGQLGDGTTMDQLKPVRVSGTDLPRFQAIDGGDAHTCALGVDGTVWCWGRNDAGQLGNSSSSNFHTPQKVTGLTGALAIALGSEHSCAILSDRAMACWGRNQEGQLGIGGSTPQRTPVRIDNDPHGVTAIAAGGKTTCAVDRDRALWCWGANDHGQFGDGTRISHDTPRNTGLADVAGVAVGHEFTCALSSPGSGGKVSCFGLNGDGQLGKILPPSPMDDSPTPVPVSFARTARAIVAGEAFACLIDGDRAVWCWGDNDNYQLADGVGDDRPILVRAAYHDATGVAGGGAHSCAVSMDGALRCTGYNAYGQLGNMRRTTHSDVRLVEGIDGAIAISGGDSHTCATRMDGTVWCWGRNDDGELGDGTWIDRPHPAPVESIAGAQMVASGLHHSCALLAGGTVACWGSNEEGQLGDGTGTHYTRGYPLPVPGLTGVEKLDAGGDTTCALAGGVVRCWGNGDSGQLGPNVDVSDTPVNIPMLAGVLGMAVGIAVGVDHACAINKDGGTVACWGENGAGQLGNGTTMDSAQPVPVMGLTGVDQVVAGDGFTCAHRADGVWCWGYGIDGQIGIDDDDVFDVPQHLVTLGMTTDRLDAGGGHACAIKPNGTLACWGSSYSGEIGDGGYGNRGTPVLSAGGATVIDVAAGIDHTCAVVDGGQVSCWGDDQHGQLGDGILADTRPVAPNLPCK